MMVTQDKFPQGKTLRVKLKIDQVVKGLPLEAGSVCDLSVQEAMYLKSIDRADIVPDTYAPPAQIITPKVATR